jgi:hypothetical protein
MQVASILFVRYFSIVVILSSTYPFIYLLYFLNKTNYQSYILIQSEFQSLCSPWPLACLCPPTELLASNHMSSEKIFVQPYSKIKATLQICIKKSNITNHPPQHKKKQTVQIMTLYYQQLFT